MYLWKLRLLWAAAARQTSNTMDSFRTESATDRFWMHYVEAWSISEARPEHLSYFVQRSYLLLYDDKDSIAVDKRDFPEKMEKDWRIR